MILTTLTTKCDACGRSVQQEVTKHWGAEQIGALVSMRLTQLVHDGWDFAPRQGGTRCPTCSGKHASTPTRPVRMRDRSHA